MRAEIESGQSRERTREEFGDILFAMVSVARHLKIDPEEALRLANAKFSARFRHVEQAVKSSGRALRDLTPKELDDHWNDAKAEAGHGDSR